MTEQDKIEAIEKFLNTLNNRSTKNVMCLTMLLL